MTPQKCFPKSGEQELIYLLEKSCSTNGGNQLCASEVGQWHGLDPAANGRVGSLSLLPSLPSALSFVLSIFIMKHL